MKLRKVCKRCNNLFIPCGKFQKICKKCYKPTIKSKETIEKSKHSRNITERLKLIKKLKI